MFFPVGDIGIGKALSGSNRAGFSYMGRFLLYLSTHWVRYRISLSDKKLRSQNKIHLEEIATLKSRLADLTTDLEAEQIKNRMHELEVDCLNELVECGRKRVEAAIRSFGVTGEETDVS